MGPKGKRLDPSQKPFLFVNEDFNTLFGGTRNPDLDRTKQSHVQRQSFAKRKRGADKKRSGEVSPATEKTSSSAGPPIIIPDTELSAASDSQNIQLRFPELTFSTPDTAWLPAISEGGFLGQSQSTDPFPPSDLAPWSTVQSTWPSETVYPQPQLLRANSHLITARLNYPSSERSSPLDNELSISSNDFYTASAISSSLSILDPFSDMRTALEIWAPPLMRNYATEMVAELFDTDLQAASLENMRHVSGLHSDMQSCMSQPAEMYALLAVTSLVILSNHGQLDLPRLAPEDSARVPLMFKLKALEALRLRLSIGSVSHGTVLAVHRMVCAALFNGNYDAVETHYRACISMMESLGGLHTFDDFQKERIIIHDLHYAFATLSPPRLQDTWDPGNLPNEIKMQLPGNRNNESGKLIRALIKESDQNIHPEVGEVILALMETRDLQLWLQARTYQPAQYRWLMYRRLALVYKLIDIDIAANNNNRPVLTANRNVLRFAVVYYAMAAISYPLAKSLAVDQFIAVVEQLWGTGENYEHVWLSSSDLLLWIVVVLNMSITFGKQSQKTIEMFDVGELTKRLSKLGRSACEELGIRNEDQLIKILKRFMFEDRFADDRFKSFVKNSLDLAIA